MVMTFKTYLKKLLFNTADRVSALRTCCLSQLENGLLLSFFLKFAFLIWNEFIENMGFFLAMEPKSVGILKI